MPEHQNLSDRLAAFIEDATALVAEVEREGREAVEEAEAAVWSNLNRFNEVQDELLRFARRDGALRGELEDLPLAHSRALLNDDAEEAAHLKDRHHEIKAELAEIAEHRPALEAKIGALGGPKIPGVPDHLRSTAVTLYQRRGVGRAVKQATEPLSRLHRDVSKPISALLESFAAIGRNNVGETTNLNSELRYDGKMVAKRQRDMAARDTSPAMSPGGSRTKRAVVRTDSTTGGKPNGKPVVISNQAILKKALGK